MTGTPAAPALLAARLGPGVRHEVRLLPDGEWFRFVDRDRVLGSGGTWQAAYEDAVRELSRPVRIQRQIEAATRDNI